MGCPVIFGDKWVMTKWLYSDDQMWMHPCLSDYPDKDNFPIFSNLQRFRSDFHLELDETKSSHSSSANASELLDDLNSIQISSNFFFLGKINRLKVCMSILGGQGDLIFYKI